MTDPARSVSDHVGSGADARDQAGLARATLALLSARIPFDRGAVYVEGETINDTGENNTGRPLVPLAFHGAQHLDWYRGLDSSPWSQVLRERSPRAGIDSFSGSAGGYRCALPLVLPLEQGDRGIGLIALERGSREFTEQELRHLEPLTRDAARRLDDAHRYEDVRLAATADERRRLAREIHDGVAQEIASLGYVVDDIRARTTDRSVRAELSNLRGQLSRISDELRLSIFDLRTDIEPGTSLGTALSSYVQQVRAGELMSVHLVLDEGARRLATGIETELLRIAQEAINNARKHSRARNLWITARIDPPRAYLRIADDGRGITDAVPQHFGLEIMRERADRLGAQLCIRSRVGGGTLIEVRLDAQPNDLPPTTAATAADSSPHPTPFDPALAGRRP